MPTYYITRDSDSPDHVDVWTDTPIRNRVDRAFSKANVPITYMWSCSARTRGTFIVILVGLYKNDIVQRVFGVLPADDKQCLQVEVDPLRVLLTELNEED